MARGTGNRKEDRGKRIEVTGKRKWERAMGFGPITHFMDIEAWKLARNLRIAVYSVIKKLPTEERYDLASQLRRAAISSTANIAEGYGRFHFQENIQFCRISRGSMYEIQDHLITCLDNEYIAKKEYESI